MSPELTQEMRQALADHPHEPVLVVDNATQQEYVLVPADAYQRIQALLYDDTDPDPDEFLPLAHEAFEEDWDAPGMEVYDKMDLRGDNP